MCGGVLLELRRKAAVRFSLAGDVGPRLFRW
jgi:hypothetical protein